LFVCYLALGRTCVGLKAAIQRLTQITTGNKAAVGRMRIAATHSTATSATQSILLLKIGRNAFWSTASLKTHLCGTRIELENRRHAGETPMAA